MKFTRTNINNLPFEEIHNVKNTRKTLATKDTTGSQYIDAITKGVLRPGEKYDWHNHVNYVEIGIILKGHGKVFCANEVLEYSPEDVFIIPASAMHKWLAEEGEDSEYYFIRVLV